MELYFQSSICPHDVHGDNFIFTLFLNTNFLFAHIAQVAALFCVLRTKLSFIVSPIHDMQLTHAHDDDDDDDLLLEHY
jgi:hypothetical protein